MKWSGLLTAGDRYGHLKCYRARDEHGTWILGNKKYAVAILNTLGMKDAKGTNVPITSTRTGVENKESGLLNPTTTTLFRRCVGIARFTRRFRGDISFAVQELSHALARPNQADMTRLEKSDRC